MTQTFENSYGDNPWEGITDKTRVVYVPDLKDVYRRTSFFRQFVPYSVNLAQNNAMYMDWTWMYELEPRTNPLGMRQMWLDTQITDTESRQITMEHHGGKVTLHELDPLITQWKKNGAGLREITRNLLGVSMTRHLDMLAMNAMFQGTWKMYGKNWDKADFSQLISAGGADNYDPKIGDEVFLGMSSRGQHGAVDVVRPDENMMGTVLALTTPGVIHSLQQEEGWVSAMKVGDPSRLLRYEVGSYRNVRYLANRDLYLWNSGQVIEQGEIEEALWPGAGAARSVDANRTVGQATLAHAGDGAQRYVQLAAGVDMTAFAVGDMVTIHNVRTNAYGVTGGVDPFDGDNSHRRVVAIDIANRRISLEEPIRKDAYTTDLGGGVFGWLTKATTVSPVMFLTGPDPVVSGVTLSPQLRFPPPVDDLMSFHRYSWTAYMKYQTWNDSSIEISFHTAPYRIKGSSRY